MGRESPTPRALASSHVIQDEPEVHPPGARPAVDHRRPSYGKAGAGGIVCRHAPRIDRTGPRRRPPAAGCAATVGPVWVASTGGTENSSRCRAVRGGSDAEPLPVACGGSWPAHLPRHTVLARELFGLGEPVDRRVVAVRSGNQQNVRSRLRSCAHQERLAGRPEGRTGSRPRAAPRVRRGRPAPPRWWRPTPTAR
jgi:hypothetical protein